MQILSNLSLYGTLGLNSVADANTDTDKFLVIDSNGIVKYRTGQELYNDIGAGGVAAYTSKLQHEVKAGVALAKGQAVYVTSADGTNMIVGKASNASEPTSSKTLGLLVQDLAINDIGFVVTEGLIAGLDTSTALAGDPVWLGTDGNLLFGLSNKPHAPAHMVFIGIVTRVQQNNGEIFVKVQNGFELDEIHNVQITSTPSDNAVLAYETSTSLYKMKSISTLLGYTPTTNARTLTINGTSYDLSADRSWSVGTHTGNLTTGYVPKATGDTTLTDSLIYDNGSGVGINTNAPYESSAFKLDVDGGVLIKNTKGVAAQLILINSNPATGGNNGFVQLSAGGNTSTAFGQWQTYYGTSIASGALRLQPAGGFVLVGSSTEITGNGLFQVAGDINITGAFRINGVAINTSSMVYPSAGIAVSTGSAWGTSITDNSSNWNAAYAWGNHASAGYLTTSSAASIYLSQVDASNTYLSQSSAANIYLNQVNASNTYLSQSSAASIYLNQVDASNTYLSQSSAASIYLNQVNASNTYLSQSSAASIYVSLSGSYSNPSWITSLTWGKITGAPAFITGITSSMVTTALGYTPYNSSNPSGYITSSALSSYLPLSGGTMTGDITMSGSGRGIYFTGGNNRIYFSGYRALEGSTTGSNLQVGEGYSQTQIQSAITQIDGNLYINNNGGRIYFDRLSGDTVGAIGFDSNDVFYVAGHPSYGPNAGNNVRVYGFGGNLHLGNATNGDVVTINGVSGAVSISRATTVSGTITSTSNLGLYVNSGGASYIGINSTSNWSYVSHLNNGSTIWDVGAFNGGQYEIRPYGGNSNRVTVQLNGQFSVNNSQNQVALFQSPNANTWVDIVSNAGTWSMGATASNRWALYNRGGSEGIRFEVGTSSVNTTGTMYAAAYRGNANVAGTGEAIYAPAGIYSTGTNWLYGTMYMNNNIIYDINIAYASGSFRAPIFYDSQDTGYYVDPNGISRVWGVAIRGDNSSTGTENQIFFWGAGNSTTSAIGFKANGGSFTNPTGFGDGYNTYLTMDSEGRGWVFRRGVGGSDFGAAYTSGWILNNGVWQANASMRAPIFYDSNNTGYYLDPDDTSNLWRFTEGTLNRHSLNSRQTNSPWSTRASQGTLYQTGAMGWGQYDLNVIASNWGSGFIDTWSNPGNAPGGSSHYVGMQAFHYNNSDSNKFHGWQMVCAQEATNRWFWRSAWDIPNRPWVEMIHSGNIGSQSVNNADTVDGYHASAFPFRSNGSSGYYQVADWLQMNTSAGLYWPSYNGAHIYANTNTYGSIRIDGSRNGWRGITFDSSVTLMMNDNESGHYKDGYGWQFRWYQGTLLVSTGYYGGGSEYSVIHSGNISNQSVSSAGYASYANSASYASSAGSASSVSIPDWRNTSYTPSQYSGNSVNWHFNNISYNNGPAGDYWGAMMTVSPWSEFNTSHRQSQIWFGGSAGLSYRYAEGYGYTPTGWSSWQKILTSADISTEASYYGNTYRAFMGYFTYGPYSNPGLGLKITNQSYSDYYTIVMNDKHGIYSPYGELGEMSPSGMYFSSGSSGGGCGGGYVSYGNQGVYGNDTRTYSAGYINHSNSSLAAYSTYYGEGIECNAWDNSNLYIGGNLYQNNWSDEKYKDNVLDIEDALDKVKSIRGVEYDWNELALEETGKNGHDVGVIAQEVQAVYPFAVREVDKERQDYVQTALVVDYEKLIPLLLQSVKELSADLDIAKTEIQTLKDRIDGSNI